MFVLLHFLILETRFIIIIIIIISLTGIASLLTMRS